MIGQDCVLFLSLTKIWRHIEAKETRYKYEFRQDKFFGGSLLEKVDWRVHRFFESCAHGDSSRICLDYADFNDVMTQVEEREFICKTPMWLKKLTKKTTPENRADNNSDLDTATQKPRGKRRRCRYSDNNDDHHVKIETHKDCLLRGGEHYRDLFNRALLRDMKQPRNKAGKVICLRGHTTGKCFHDCRLKSGHAALALGGLRD